MRAVLVALDRALGRHRRLTVDVDQPEVGEAVLVLLRLDQEENLLAVFVEQIVIGVDLVVVGRRDDDADVTDAQASAASFLNTFVLLDRRP